MARIAILGWGSLIWDQRELPTTGNWLEGGPSLPLEFSRKSADGRLTLVIDPEHGREAPTRYAESSRHELDDAVCDLMHREGMGRDNIGWIDRRTAPNQTLPRERRIWQWAVNQGFDFVIWTKLQPKVPQEWNGFSLQGAESYLRNLPRICKDRAREYIVKAPPEVRTPLRDHLQDWLKEP